MSSVDGLDLVTLVTSAEFWLCAATVEAPLWADRYTAVADLFVAWTAATFCGIHTHNLKAKSDR